ncbi:10085_t:CDS:2, partial [Paraglomus occultum]
NAVQLAADQGEVLVETLNNWKVICNISLSMTNSIHFLLIELTALSFSDTSPPRMNIQDFDGNFFPG